jgi:hypothetical protein
MQQFMEQWLQVQQQQQQQVLPEPTPAYAFNPFAFLQPHISHLLATAAALAGAAGSHLSGCSSSSSSSGQLAAVAQLIAVKTAREIMCLQQEQVVPEVAAAASVPRTAQQGAAAHASVRSNAAAGPNRNKLGSWRSFTDFEAFMASMPQGSSQSRRELEAAGNTSWWKEAGIDKRRVSDIRKLLAAVNDKAVQLTAERGQLVTTADAAQQLDSQCREEQITLTGYFTKYLKARGKK